MQIGLINNELLHKLITIFTSNEFTLIAISLKLNVKKNLSNDHCTLKISEAK